MNTVAAFITPSSSVREVDSEVYFFEYSNMSNQYLKSLYLAICLPSPVSQIYKRAAWFVNDHYNVTTIFQAVTR